MQRRCLPKHVVQVLNRKKDRKNKNATRLRVKRLRPEVKQQQRYNNIIRGTC